MTYIRRMRVRAARLAEHGNPLLIEDVELVRPAPGEVVVDMAYAGVNPIDLYGALGEVAADGPLPRTLGCEGSGEVGGRPVVVRGHGLGSQRDGLWATKAVVPAAAVIEIPAGVELTAAAGMGVAGVTAWRVVNEIAGVTGDDRVLVLGGGGGVGSIAVSAASSLGATVWAQTIDPAKAGWIAARGADRVVVADASALVEEASELRATVVIDPLGGEFSGAAIDMLEPRGRLVVLGTSAGARGNVPLRILYRKALTVYGYGGLIEDDDVLARHVADAMDALRDGRLEVVVDRILPLHQVDLAFELLRHHEVRGKLLIDLRR